MLTVITSSKLMQLGLVFSPFLKVRPSIVDFQAVVWLITLDWNLYKIDYQ